MSDPTSHHRVIVLDDETRLEVAEFAQACGTSVTYVNELILEGVLIPRETAHGFGGAEIARVRRVLRLQRDFDATLPSAAVILDLLEEIERLRTRLQRVGAEGDG